MLDKVDTPNSNQPTSQTESHWLFGDDHEAESQGSRMSYNLLPSEQEEGIFDRLTHEVNWQKMHHHTGEVPRLVCCQGTLHPDGSMPVYRHPSDKTMLATPWTPTVDLIRRAAENIVGHNLNHALIQLYRGGTDYISEHSDKTLDIMPDSTIVNASFGAQRTMRLRTKRPQPASSPAASSTTSTITSIPTQSKEGRETYRIPLPNNSLLSMTLRTNARYLHGINPDRRRKEEWSEAESACDGQRISLTFRNIGTWLSEDESRIWGLGARGKAVEDAGKVVSGGDEDGGGEGARQSEMLLKAFGRENQGSEVAWEEIYGDGWDVLHLR